jgi:hypothetical protein
MGLLGGLFERVDVAEFAKGLAEDISKRYPPALDQEPGKRPSVNRLTRIIEDACSKAVDFGGKHRLGWLAKAKLGNAFRWELVALGYQKDFVDLATEAVVVHLSRNAPPTKQEH